MTSFAEPPCVGEDVILRATIPLDIVIRLCRTDDLPRLEWFGQFSHHREIIRDAYALQVRGEALMLLAVVGDFPVGQAWLDLRPRPAAQGPSVWAVRILDPLQGVGLGRRLMRALESVALERGHTRLELTVERHNEAARLFYEALGWRLVGERQESYSYVTPAGHSVVHALDEWVMVKDLAQGQGSSPTRA